MLPDEPNICTSRWPSTSIPLLVVSCDRYADLWPPFFDLFWRRWPDCPFPIYLGSNHKTWPDPRVRNVSVGDDASWATGVRRMLEQIQSRWVILFLEDFLLKAPVQTTEVLRIVETAVANDVSTARLAPLPPPSRVPRTSVPGVPFLGAVEPGTPYRVSAQPALWRVDALVRYLVPGFSAWEFELIGSQLSDYRSDVFWGPFAPAIEYDHGVEKGRWKQEGLRICADAGVPVDRSARGAFSEAELEAHYHAGIDGSVKSAAKLQAIDAFSRGQRRAGAVTALRLLAQHPWSFQLWAILGFGLVGPASMQQLRRQHLRRRVRQALRREAVPSSPAARYF